MVLDLDQLKAGKFLVLYSPKTIFDSAAPILYNKLAYRIERDSLDPAVPAPLSVLTLVLAS